MLRMICALLSAMTLGVSASAATLTVDSDKTTYLVGETITLTVSGDDGGATSYSIYGRLVFSGALVDNATRSQTTLAGPEGPWIANVLNFGDDGTDGFSEAFSQVTYVEQTADNLPSANPFATVTLIAAAVGLVDVSWVTESFLALEFFGLTSAPGTSFEIVPEPGTASLLGLGLIALGIRRRRH